MKEVRHELVTGSAKHVASLIALYHMQTEALTLKKDQPTLPSDKHSSCLKHRLLVKMCMCGKERRADTGSLLILSA